MLADITSGVGGRIRPLEPPAPVQEAAMCEGSDWFRVCVEEEVRVIGLVSRLGFDAEIGLGFIRLGD